MPKIDRGSLLNHLDEVEAKCLEGDPTLQDILDIFGADGHYVLILFLIIPFLQPIPLLGLSVIFGLIISFVAWLAYFKRPPYISKRWAAKKLSAKTVSRIAEGVERVLEKIKLFVHPRLKFLFQGPFRVVNTVLIFVSAILLALPLPVPFSNALPAWVILLQSLAHLEDDGLLILISYIQSLLCAIFFILLAKGALAATDLLGNL